MSFNHFNPEVIQIKKNKDQVKMIYNKEDQRYAPINHQIQELKKKS